MGNEQRLIERFRALTAEADALPVPETDPEAIRQDLLITWKERCKRDADRYAKQGCYRNGNAPKKSIVHNYKKTKDYHRRYEEALERNEFYRKIMDESIFEDPVFVEEYEEKLRRAGREARRAVRKEIAKKLRKISKSYIHSLNLENFYEKNQEEVLKKQREMTDAFIRSDRKKVTVTYTENSDRLRIKKEELSASNWEYFLSGYVNEIFLDQLFDQLMTAGVCASSALVCVFCAHYPFLGELIASEDTGESASVVLNQIASHLTEEVDEDAFLRKFYDFDRISELLEENAGYSSAVREGMLKSERQGLIAMGIQDVIPSHYPDLFPLARAMRRHFILHIGPTNSGKTHDAIEALINADSGVYLAPLRLLAYEQYDTLNRAGAACTLVTGEERRVVDGAQLRSSTIEMLDFKKRYDVAVIDEAQMATDDERGGAWTAAILGVRAKEIHVCSAPSAETLLKRLVSECGDTCEVVRHERKTPLVFEKHVFR
ncbi:MAG: hypothetical protein J6D07_00210, partial [Mogibacterium sp.]|nr:hypothetical protein [Mogibacterium sp.]